MYQSGKDQLMQARKESSNKRLITEDIDQMIRNKMIMQGLTPIMELDESIVSDKRNEIMEIIKSITKQPKKVYSELFNRNELDDFYIVSNEFIKKYLKGRKNLTSNVFLLEWDKFKVNPLDRPFSVEESKKLFNTVENLEESKRRGIKNIQGKERNILYSEFEKNKQEIDTRDKRIKELFRIRNKGINEGSISYGEEQKLDDEIMKLSKEKKYFEELIKRVPSRESTQRKLISEEEQNASSKLEDIQMQIQDLNEQYNQLTSVDKRKKDYKDRIEELKQLKEDLLKEMSGSGLRKKQKKNLVQFKQVRLLVDPTKMFRKAIYPINKNWSWM